MSANPWTPNPPNLADYTTFLYNVVGIPEASVQGSDIEMTFSVAMDIVNDQLSVTASLYPLAVYNLGADRLINYASDIPGQTYFLDLRKNLRINEVSVGVASAANDQGTSVGILNPEVMKNFTLMDLQTLKTPQGRAYMGIAQSVGTIWGLT